MITIVTNVVSSEVVAKILALATMGWLTIDPWKQI